MSDRLFTAKRTKGAKVEGSSVLSATGSSVREAQKSTR